MSEQSQTTRPYYGARITPGQTGPHPDPMQDALDAMEQAFTAGFEVAQKNPNEGWRTAWTKWLLKGCGNE